MSLIRRDGRAGGKRPRLIDDHKASTTAQGWCSSKVFALITPWIISRASHHELQKMWQPKPRRSFCWTDSLWDKHTRRLTLCLLRFYSSPSVSSAVTHSPVDTFLSQLGAKLYFLHSSRIAPHRRGVTFSFPPPPLSWSFIFFLFFFQCELALSVRFHLGGRRPNARSEVEMRTRDTSD